MRLFHQLSSDEQNASIHHCLHIVINDMLDEDSEFKVEINDHDEECVDCAKENQKLQTHIKSVIKKARKLPEDERFKYILNDEEISEIVFDISLNMAKSAYYHDSDEMCIFPDQLFAGDEEDEDIGDLIEEKSKGTKHSLN